MKRSVVLAAVSLACITTSQAQIGVVSGISKAVETLRKNGDLPPVQQPPPTQPSGFDQLPPREGQLPPPEESGEAQGQIRVLRGNYRVLGSKLTATDHPQILYKGYQIFADRVEGNLKTNDFHAVGNVRIIGHDSAIVGDSVDFNTDTRNFTAYDADSQISPSLAQGNLKGPLYVRGKKTFGNPRRMFGEHTVVTTCDKDRPHFEIDSDSTDLRPGKRVILRRARLKLFGRTILKVPYLVIPLDQPNYRYLPEFGRSTEEGYFLKNRYGIPIRGNTVFYSRLDYYEKLGTGYGGDLVYDTLKARGIFHTFIITGQQPLVDISSQHVQRFKWGTLSLDNSYQKSSYLTAPDSTLQSSRMMLDLPQGRSDSRLSFFRNSNASNGFNTTQQTFGLDDQRYYGGRAQTTVSLNYSQSSTSSSSSADTQREQLDVRLKGQQEFDKGTAMLQYQRAIPIGENANFVNASDVTPELSLTSDSRKLIGASFDKILPFRTVLSIGEYSDPRTKSRLSRENFDFNFNRSDNSASRFKFQMTGRFRQAMYSDDTAQYVMQLGTTASYRLGQDTAFNIRYNYLRPYGFAPLQMDRTGKTNQITGDLSIRPIRSIFIGAQTGYDLISLEQGRQTPWQNISARLEWQPTDYFGIRALPTYDTFNNVWSNVRLDMTYLPGSTFVSAGARYDGVRKQWAAANFFVDGLRWGRLKTSAILSYNGYLKKFEAQHFQFTYDLHCAEAILTILDDPIGFNSGRTITFFIRIKALPFDTPFGVGKRGQPIGTGTGVGY